MSAAHTLGFRFLLPRQITRARCTVWSGAVPKSFMEDLAAEVELDLDGGLSAMPDGQRLEESLPLDAAIFFGHPDPRRNQVAALDRAWARLRAGGVLMVACEPWWNRWRTLTRADWRRVPARRLRSILQRVCAREIGCWHVYPGVSRPMMMASADADAKARSAALGHIGGVWPRRLASLLGRLGAIRLPDLSAPGHIFVAEKR